MSSVGTKPSAGAFETSPLLGTERTQSDRRIENRGMTWFAI
jgi:hypothetical protein